MEVKVLTRKEIVSKVAKQSLTRKDALAFYLFKVEQNKKMTYSKVRLETAKDLVKIFQENGIEMHPSTVSGKIIAAIKSYDRYKKGRKQPNAEKKWDEFIQKTSAPFYQPKKVLSAKN